MSLGASRLVASITGIALIATLTLAAGGPAVAVGSAPTPASNRDVAGKSAPQVAQPAAPASSTSVVPAAGQSIQAGDFSGSLATAPQARSVQSARGRLEQVAGGWNALGTSGVAVAAARSPLASATAPRTGELPVLDVAASVLSAKEAKAYGLKGLVIALQRSDATSVAGPLAVQIPNSLLAGRYGADFASRLRWVAVAPATTSPAATAKAVNAAPTVSSAPDPATSSTVLFPQSSSKMTLLTAAASPVSSTGTGSFTATSLAPSTTWDVSAQTGDFSWKFPLRTPPAAAGPSPQLALNYDSQTVDGESASTNNQPSAIGEGWSQSGGGFIERTYVSCSQDTGSSGPVTSSGDQCWKTDNATISFGGHSGQLIKDASTGTWKLQSDDNSRVEHLVGTGCGTNGTWDNDCWRVTTTDGTQYYFGRQQLPGWVSGKPSTQSTWTVPVFGNDPGEPCHAASFAASSCAQAWRWNLDYVVDTHNNAEALYYDAETNSYAQNGGSPVSYIRGGQLDHIDYGFTDGNAYATNAASDRVTFSYAADGRCSDATLAHCTPEPIGSAATAPASPTYYPDVPFDQLCTSSCATNVSPTFWTDAMLATINTYVLTSGAYAQVDGWTLSHSFPDPGDGTSAALWLTQIGHTGYSGSSSLAEPNTVFTGTTLQNRVWVVDGLAPLDKYRIASIATATGAVISVNYSAQQCTPSNAAAIEASPQSNTSRCFPQWWTPTVTYPAAPQEDLFHKYVVTSVISNPETGGGNDQSLETDYVYTGTPAWRYDNSPLTPEAFRTWSVFAGYNSVEVRQGSGAVPSQQQTTDYTFYQGMDGDRASSSGGTKTVFVTGTTTVHDSLWFAGQLRETKVLNGVGGATLSDTISTPWASAVTANDGTNTARITNTAETQTSEPVSTGGNRTTDTTTTFDSTYGLPTSVNSTASDAPSSCTTTSYAAANTTAWIIGLPNEVASVGVDCSSLSSATYPAAAISDERTSYDGGSPGSAATKGDATKVEKVDSYSGSTAATAQWTTFAQYTYDSMGRPLQSTDVLGHTNTNTYTPAAGAAVGSGPLTSETLTNTAPFSWTSSISYNPAWGVETSATDVNGKITSATYDALGRRSAVWFPDNPKATNPNQPSASYHYTLSTTAASFVETDVLTPVATVASFGLFDGLGRQVQSQTPAEGGGSAVSDNWYDSQGRTWTVNGTYWTTAVNPSGVLFVPAAESQISSETVTQYDGAGRTTATILDSLGVERFRTTDAYPGADRVDVTPPSGGTPTSTFTNTLGQKTQLRQYLSSTTTGTAESTGYGYDASGRMTSMTDPAGNQWGWQFDVLGHQVHATDPDTGSTTSSYDDAGNLLTSTDARGTVLAYSYDALNRKTGEFLNSTGSSGTPLDAWTYDSIAKGQLTSAISYTGSTPGTPGLAYKKSVNSYDAQYNVTSQTVSIPAGAPAFGGTSYVTTSAYYKDGSLASVLYQAEGGLASERVRTSYDTLGRVGTLSGTSGYDLVKYTPIGQLSENQRIGTATLYTDYGYDLATGATTDIQSTDHLGTTFTTLADAGYAYDNAGNVTSIKTTSNTLATDTQCFTYDHLQELASAWTPSSNSCVAAPSSSALGGPAPYWTDYTVDPQTGNRLSTVEHAITGTGTSTNDSYSYPTATSARPHAVQSVTHTGGATGTSSYGYDATGDTTARPGQTLSYDPASRLSTVNAGSTSQANIYDADGTLLLQTNSVSGATLYMGDTELHLATGAGTASAVRTYSVNGIPVAERTTTVGISGSKLTWLVTDAQGTVAMQVDAIAGTATVRQQDPYGQARGTSTAAWSDNHGFLNATTSATVGLTQLGARAYDSGLGKFLSVDAVLAPFNPVQNNGYAYSGNSPVTGADPTGDCYNADLGAINSNRNCSTSNSQNLPGPGGSSGKQKSGNSHWGPEVPPAPGNPFGRALAYDLGGPYNWMLQVPGLVPPSFLDHVGGVTQDGDGIIRSEPNPWQLFWGYGKPMDDLFAVGALEAHKTFPWQVGNKSYEIEAWLGDYPAYGDGGEVEILSQDKPLRDIAPDSIWNAVYGDPSTPTMSMSVNIIGGPKVSSAVGSPTQPWVTAWNAKVNDLNVDDLHFRATVAFSDPAIYAAFKSTYGTSAFWSFPSQGTTATLNFH